uniref:Odorant receptor n=1 Tax=Anopheles stephensi TaxID=30069 RepID=A0A182YAR8_ANOST
MVVKRALLYSFSLLQHHFNVGHPLEHFCLLRCLDVVSPAMLIQRPRSGLEIGIKTLSLSVLLTHVVGLAYDLTQQEDIRVAMDIFCMLSLFSSLFARNTCLRQYQSHIIAMERLDANPGFEVGVPYAETIRHRTVTQNNRYLGWYLVSHFLTVTIYVTQNMAMQGSFVKIITHFPIDLSGYAPALDTMTQFFYTVAGYGWAWYHAAGQLIVIVLLRFVIAEFRVFLHSLATLDEQIHDRLLLELDGNEERVVRELLYKHARQHSQLIVVVMHLRAILRIYSLVHFSFYMIIMAAFMARVLVIPGSSSLGMAIPVLVTIVFFLETFGLCMLVEKLVQLNRRVSVNLYGFGWTRYLQYGHSIKRTMMLMIMQANNTKDFSAGGLTTVSAELFAKTCRLVYTMMMGMANLAT